MSRVVSMRLKENQMERLQRMARHLGRTPSETSALLVDEALRMADFAFIEFRNSPVGRQAYIKGSSLAVWEVLMIARDNGMDPEKTADHLAWPVVKVQAALNYAEAFSEEVGAALADNDACDFESLRRMLPQAVLFQLTDEPEESKDTDNREGARSGESAT